LGFGPAASALIRRTAAAAFVWAGALVGALPAQALMAGLLPDSPQARLLHGEAARQFGAAGTVMVGGSAFSGVAVSRRYVLSAAHVLGGQAPGNTRFVLPGGGPQGLEFEVEAVELFPGTVFPYDDLALMRLKQPLPDTVILLPIYPGMVEPGQRIVLVGAGASGNGDSGPATGAERNVLRIGGNVLDRVATRVDGSGRTSSFFEYDFDGPEGNGPLGGPTIGNGEETVAAGGDSGGPVFASISGQFWLIGISTFVRPAHHAQGTAVGFGAVGGGLLLSYPPFGRWLEEHLREP
jgi:hypothetical protein